ncbi:nucleoside ABC transporter membrane protein [Dethiosulfatibacter aminovorans DSM 17477]|uniref:Nucleoside ABC transporter membrane protein n=2 Tax=Dethiosulfatibacter TaxID=448125 RepID=A0A1M6FQ00_9FIRM|nr:nucleoside ABC transporter membrane protein [Dethiosulfatibacter aminovorans DSM 17477]
MRMIKRADITPRQSALIKLYAVLSALIASSFFIFLLGHNPLDVYVSMAKGAFGSAYRIKDTITITIPLVVTSVGIMIAFKMKFWNIGAEGQILVGALFASYVALNFDALPKPLLLLVMMIAGFAGGGLWAMIPAMLKVRFDTNETIVTLMMNYIALQWITYLQYGPWKDPNSMGFPKIANFADNAVMPKIFGVHVGWIFAIFLVVLMTFVMRRTKQGYQIAVVGESKNTARYSGINVSKVIVLSIIVSGGICGIAGMMQASAVNQTLNTQLSAGYGYTAIITAWLSGLSPILIVPVSVLFAAMTKGGSFIQTAFQIPQSAAEIIQSLILFFVIGSEFFVQYKLVFNKKGKKEDAA